ncbi:hypothetical protein FNV43_RR19232 [Rhamnella rubrinervis]|uniref:AP2/ERF domain-containing protein n=1 Tax=Rhamnella rubrinervis TaxID=2594499 RepID=A0A8K0E286_9ROSA|nr:hypothetical protein FNV43_RR19232 [Rhamnella rubrinervis]
MSIAHIQDDPPPHSHSQSNKTASPSLSKRRRSSSNNATPFRGVRKRSWGRYVSEIRLPGQKTRVWLGSFGSPDSAAVAYDSAALYLKGNSATLNFPHLAESLPTPVSSSRRDIQSAAAKAALDLMNKRSSSSFASDSTRESVYRDDCTDLGSEFWMGLEFDFEGEKKTVSFDEVKEAPLLSPLSFGAVSGDIYDVTQFIDEDNLLSLPSYLYE